MMKLLATAGLAAACLASPPAMSWEGWKGSDLLKACRGASMSDQSLCIGFILGVVEGLRAGQRLAELEQGLAAPDTRPSFCLDGVKPADIVELVVRDLAKSSPRALADNSLASAIGWAQKSGRIRARSNPFGKDQPRHDHLLAFLMVANIGPLCITRRPYGEGLLRILIAADLGASRERPDGMTCLPPVL